MTIPNEKIKYTDRSFQLANILSLLQHGDELLLREIGEHIGTSRYTAASIIKNHRALFDIYKTPGGPGTGQGIKRLYSLSEEGLARHRNRNRSEDLGPDARFLIQTRQPLLVLLYCKVWGPIRLSNASRHLAE